MVEEIFSDYNSLLYLNDNFSGGEFFTETGLTIKPIPGRLTFFDGSIVTHGVNKSLRSSSIYYDFLVETNEV